MVIDASFLGVYFLLSIGLSIIGIFSFLHFYLKRNPTDKTAATIAHGSKVIILALLVVFLAFVIYIEIPYF